MIRVAAASVLIALAATASAVASASRMNAGPAAHVLVKPGAAAVFAGTALRLHADIVGGSASVEAITWSLFGPGRVDADGTYHAPLESGADATIVASANAAAGAARLTIVSPPPERAPLVVVACYGDGALDIRSPGGAGPLGRLAAGAEIGGIGMRRDGAAAVITDGQHVASIDLATMTVRDSRDFTGARFSEAAALHDDLIAATDANAGPQDQGLFIFRAPPSQAPVLVASAPAGDTPEGLAVSADGRTLYVTAVNSDSLMRFSVGDDGSLRLTGSARTGTRPFGVALAEHRNVLLVADNDTPTLSGRASRPGLEFFALPAMRRIGVSIATGTADALPLGIAVDESSDRAFVTNEGDDDVAVFSLSTRRQLASLAVGRTPWLPAVDPRRHILYVPDARDDTLDAFDTRSLSLVARGAETCDYPTAVGIAR